MYIYLYMYIYMHTCVYIPPISRVGEPSEIPPRVGQTAASKVSLTISAARWRKRVSKTCCSVLQCDAVCCSALQCVAVCCSVLQCVAVCCSVLQCVAVWCSVSVLQGVAVCCSVLQCITEWEVAETRVKNLKEPCFTIAESCHAYEWVMSHMWMSHVPHVNESCHKHEWVMSHMWRSHVQYMNEWCHIYERLMSHIWRRQCVMSHICTGHVRLTHGWEMTNS